VAGHAWIDHQWGAWSYTNKEYWQLQMENGIELSIFRLYAATGLVYEHFYKVGLNGHVTDIDD
jgi:predicted secreted hydrolase